ncbi:MAG TPA: DNA-directed RNA polymerase subunit omega [Clostridiales bacterium]|jgi:DNA-directed RNA polymerase omega subunit|nr:DNA-directed RNA polymerase subunit omega [Clostridiales bacterium]
MMYRPPVNELEEKVGNRYLLVSVVAKRAHQIMEEYENCSDNQALVEAINEVYNDELIIIAQ